MKENLKYVVAFLAISLGIFLLWYFKAIVFFVFIAAILSLVTRPLFNFFIGLKKGKAKRKLSLSRGWAALTTVLLMWLIVLGLFSYIVPFVVEEVHFLSKVDVSLILERVVNMLSPVIDPFQDSIIGKKGFPLLKEQINDILVSVFDFGKIQGMLSYLADFVGSAFMAMFSISFITFFLLKDEWLLLESIKLFVPKVYYVGVEHMLWSINRLLRRYFIGILIQITLVSTFGDFWFLASRARI